MSPSPSHPRLALAAAAFVVTLLVAAAGSPGSSATTIALNPQPEPPGLTSA
jgi:hypothetical protein